MLVVVLDTPAKPFRHPSMAQELCLLASLAEIRLGKEKPRMREEAVEWTLGPDNLAISFCLLASNVLTQLTNLQLLLLTFSTFDISAISALHILHLILLLHNSIGCASLS